MSINLILCSAAFAIAVLISIVYLLIKKRINVKFALVWIILFLVLLIAILIPGFLQWLTEILGFQTPSNMVLTIFIAVLIVINIASTVAISSLQKSRAKLIQEISLLKNQNSKDTQNY